MSRLSACDTAPNRSPAGICQIHNTVRFIIGRLDPNYTSNGFLTLRSYCGGIFEPDWQSVALCTIRQNSDCSYSPLLNTSACCPKHCRTSRTHAFISMAGAWPARLITPSWRPFRRAHDLQPVGDSSCHKARSSCKSTATEDRYSGTVSQFSRRGLRPPRKISTSSATADLPGNNWRITATRPVAGVCAGGTA